MIVVDVPTLREVWKQWRQNYSMLQQKKIAEQKDNTNNNKNKKRHTIQKDLQPVAGEAAPILCTQRNYFIPLLLPAAPAPAAQQSKQQQNKEDPLLSQSLSWQDQTGAFMTTRGPLVLCFLLGALTAHWFHTSRKASKSKSTTYNNNNNNVNNTNNNNVNNKVEAVAQRVDRFEQRLALVEANQKISKLEGQLLEGAGVGVEVSSLLNNKGGLPLYSSNSYYSSPAPPTRQQQQQAARQHLTIPTDEVRWEGTMVSPTSTMVSDYGDEEEAALLKDMMLASTAAHAGGGGCGGGPDYDDFSTTSSSDNQDLRSNKDETNDDASDVGALLEDFQSELNDIQETLRTGNYIH